MCFPQSDYSLFGDRKLERGHVFDKNVDIGDSVREFLDVCKYGGGFFGEIHLKNVFFV